MCIHTHTHTHTVEITLFHCVYSYFIHKVRHVKSLCVIINIYIINTHMHEMLHMIYLEMIWYKLCHRDITLYVYYNINPVHLYILFIF